jgi:hypothetical protein
MALLSLRVVLGAAWKRVDAAIDLDCDARFANCEIHGVSADLMLTHDVYAFSTHETQRLPRPLFASAHAAASLGWFWARQMSQAPMRIIGMDSSMPMVITPRSASGIWLSGSRTISNSARKRP